MSTGMAAENIGRTAVAAIVLLAALLLLLPASAAAGSCSRENRVDHRDAECLSAWWKNRGLFRESPYFARNMCHEYGKVVAKVDLVSARDRTFHLTDHIPREDDTSHRIRGISCCTDMGGICNRSDVVTDEGCLERFLQVSPAAQNLNCLHYTATAEAGENFQCTVTAQCDVGVHPYRPLYRTTSVTVPWLDLDDVQDCKGVLTHGICRPIVLWVRASDPEVEEAEGASLDFRVTLSEPFPETVTVRYRTSDESATAGLDYVTTAGVLAFAPGETSKTVSVPVLDDDLDEWPETVRFWLSEPNVPEAIVPGWFARGTIVNTDPMPKAWIARFGRTVADQVLDAVDARMRAKPAPGVEARLAGQRTGLGPPFGAGSNGNTATGPSQAPEMQAGGQRALQDLAGWPHGGAEPAIPGFGPRPDWQSATERDLLLGSSFSLTAETDGEGFVSVWGQGTVTRFSGRDPASAAAGGEVAVDGEVASGLLGADWTRGRWTAGLVVSHSLGDGGYRGAARGTLSATLTGVWPWAHHVLGERLSVWGVAGYGEGSLSLEPRAEDGTHAGAIRTDLDLVMAAVGLRGVAVDGGRDGLTLAVNTDAMMARTASDAVSGTGGNLAAAEAEVTRLRFGLEGSRPFRLGDGSTLTPSVEIGVRRDGGDAETGFGADIGGGLAWTEPQRGLSAELRGRGLLSHESKGFRERGLSASFAWEPVAGGRGPRLSLTRTLGGPVEGGADALLERTTLAGLAANDNGQELQQRRLEARFGYGFAAFGDRFTSTPEISVGLSNAGRDYSLGWRLMRGGGVPDGSALELGVEVRRSEMAADPPTPPEHAVGFRATSRF